MPLLLKKRHQMVLWLLPEVVMIVLHPPIKEELIKPFNLTLKMDTGRELPSGWNLANLTLIAMLLLDNSTLKEERFNSLMMITKSLILNLTF